MDINGVIELLKQASGEGEEVVKCGCGLPMRSKNWPTHWVGCRVASSAPVTEQDVKNLEAHERRLAAERQ